MAGEMIISNDRYQMTETENSMYAVQMILIVKKLQKSDMGGECALMTILRKVNKFNSLLRLQMHFEEQHW
jgi:hypothetical protein